MRNLSDIKCPQCMLKQISTLTEIIDHSSIEYLVEDGKISSTGIIEHGSPVKILAACMCGHEWVLRKVKLIESIEAERFNHFLADELEG